MISSNREGTAVAMAKGKNHHAPCNDGGRAGGLWLAALMMLVSVLVPADDASAQSVGHYDPRSWTYDPGQRIVVAPSGEAMALEPRGAAEHSPLPRENVAFTEPYPEGSILIDTSERRLYHVLGNGRAIRYAVGVGREGFSWTGRDRVSNKREWPDWRPPAEMRQRERAKGRVLPAHVPGGPNNPLGARALYIGTTLYRIHGTNQPWTIGTANSSGCIRMTNDDVVHLYNQVAVGAEVIVRR